MHLPQFIDCEPVNAPLEETESHSQHFIFSALFQSSPASSPGLSALNSTPTHKLGHSLIQTSAPSSFIGFSWGPLVGAFPDSTRSAEYPGRHQDTEIPLSTPRPVRLPTPQFTSYLLPVQPSATTTPHLYTTPVRSTTGTPHQTLPRTNTSRRTAPRRTVSDREAMKQLVDCVGMSARKKVLESGRKPRILSSFNRSGMLKELRFHPVVDCAKPGAESAPGSLMSLLSGSEDTDTEGPPSPSPSPRPGSAMSRRSGTPTTTASYSRRIGLGTSSISNATLSMPLPNTCLNDPVDRKRDIVEVGARKDMRLYELEEKHALLMRDILDIKQRLRRFSMTVSKEG